MSELMKKLHELGEGNFWTHMNELVEEIEELGLEIDNYNREYIVAITPNEAYDDMQTFIIHLGGTERTIIITYVEEV